ncbi:Squalene epoxidase [Nowakowskiella sp. JEL0407]|nr:Squalene epoxidase [Nowakowskiella sp. JEL0407]
MEESETKPLVVFKVIVIGAGVVGCATAHGLASDGRKVLLLERDWKEPHRIVGELLQPGGIKALQKLSLEHCIKGIGGIPTVGYAVFKKNENVMLKYPTEEDSGNSLNGIAFHYGRFIMKLRVAATSKENVFGCDAIASSLIMSSDGERIFGVSCFHRSGTEEHQIDFHAPLVIAADGCFSKFRNICVPKEKIVVSSHFAGFLIKNCNLPHPGHGHVILAEPSPILLYQVSSTQTRCLVDIPGKLPSKLKDYMKDVVLPQLPDQVKESFLISLDSEKLQSMPASWLPCSSQRQKGLILIGDALNMRNPLTGGGMTVGLWDVVHLLKALRKNEVPDMEDCDLIIRRMEKYQFNERKPLAGVINVNAMALHALCSAGKDNCIRALQDTIFEYFKLGGKCASVPMGLLGG